ncbi:MAG: CrcB family protein [Actinomycetia bacterium]|nr:CrcB family protein [Actinomycetes bacterium]MCP4962821.1 CrcB family protein [Actinomycetes bacterium]
MIVPLFCLAAAIGAMVRYVVTNEVNHEWPVGTLLVNVCGSLAIGVAHSLTGGSATVVAIAGIGSLTSISTVADEVATLARGGRHSAALAYLSATLVLAVAAAAVGLSLG